MSLTKMNYVVNTCHPASRKLDSNTLKTFLRFYKKPKAYRPNLFEEECYSLWQSNGLFQPWKRAEVFSIILPPPNITGSLHLGHALTISIQDAIARWKRMCDNEVIWVPGVDHAGIATQVVVEKSITKKKGKSRFDIGRDEFIAEVWKWKNEKCGFINSQMKKLGASVDWEREVFTMDDNHAKAVTHALLQLYKKELIYRNESLVNWSPHLRSVISDIEVDYIELVGPTSLSLPGYSRPVMFGNLIDFSYRVVGSDKEIVVSTTRIETLFGDAAVAVNPEDDRYKPFWGCRFLHPFNGTEIPLVLDYRIDPSFGTGAVKITPAHDPNDFQISKSHNLPKRSVINEQGILENCGHFTGMKRFEARESICNELANLGLLRQIRPHKMKIPLCSRSGDVIEYLIKPQWFLKSKNMAERALDAVKDKKLIITPKNYQANWFHWLENIQDWCISRQLWWGHQLPFYFCEGNQSNIWVAAKSEEEALKMGRNYISGPLTIYRDPDVLDTWFSSGILPFTCFGWPEKTEELKKYYPLSILITGNDILFFWVARMVMLGLELTDQLPFKEVFLHGIICDSHGRKMSKSLGNVIAPEDIINGKSFEELNKTVENSMLNIEEIHKAKTSLKNLFSEGIPEYGVDALRFALLSSNIKNQYINFDTKHCNTSRLFCNKIWQACSFADEWLKKLCSKSEVVDLDYCENHTPLSLMEIWILAKLNCLIQVVNKGLEHRDFHIASNSIRNFIHFELCDIYIESIKPTLQKGPSVEAESSLLTLVHVLIVSLKCLSPFMPFVTEYLYGTLPIKRTDFLMETSYPVCNEKKIDNTLIESVSSILTIISEIRRIKHKGGRDYQKIPVWIDNDTNDLLHFKEVIETLAKCKVYCGKPKLEEDNYVKEFLAGYEIYFHQNIYQTKVVESSLLFEKRNMLKQKLTKLIEMSKAEGYKKKAPLKVQKLHYDKVEEDGNETAADGGPSEAPATPLTEASTPHSSSVLFRNTSRSHSSTRKRKGVPNDDGTADVMKLVGKKLESLQAEDAFQVFGKHVANKLRDVSTSQNAIAQKLISDVLFEAELGTLTRNFQIVDMASQRQDDFGLVNGRNWHQQMPQQLKCQIFFLHKLDNTTPSRSICHVTTSQNNLQTLRSMKQLGKFRQFHASSHRKVNKINRHTPVKSLPTLPLQTTCQHFNQTEVLACIFVLLGLTFVKH